MKLSRDLHRAQSFSITLGIRHAKVAVDLLLGIAGLLVSDDEDLFAVEAGHTADDGRIVGETAVPMNLAPVGEDALHIVEGIWTLWMARHFSALPGVQVR